MSRLRLRRGVHQIVYKRDHTPDHHTCYRQEKKETGFARNVNEETVMETEIKDCPIVSWADKEACLWFKILLSHPRHPTSTSGRQVVWERRRIVIDRDPSRNEDDVEDESAVEDGHFSCRKSAIL